MLGDSRGALSAARSPREILDAAVRRAAKRLDSVSTALATGGMGRAEGYLGTLQSKLERVLAGDDPAPIREWLIASPMHAPMLDALMQELLDQSATPQDASAQTLAVLRACAQLRTAPAQVRPEASAEEDMRARMRRPDAFGLLVEVAHDFRSPLTSILFLAEAMRDGSSGPVTDLQKTQLGLMYSAAFGLASIASDIMDLARESKDLIGPEKEAFSVAELFQKVERMVRPIVEEKGLEFRVVVPQRWRGVGHPHALSRVLLNLTTNALKFTDEGRVELGVHARPHGIVEYYVMDTGRGISPEEQRTLFQPFRRRSAQAHDGHHFSSSGFGLSIARRLLRAMGSDLILDSSDERGTRFSFCLPTSV